MLWAIAAVAFSAVPASSKSEEPGLVEKIGKLQAQIDSLQTQVQQLTAQNLTLTQNVAQFIAQGTVKVSDLPAVGIDPNRNAISYPLPPIFAAGAAIHWVGNLSGTVLVNGNASWFSAAFSGPMVGGNPGTAINSGVVKDVKNGWILLAVAGYPPVWIFVPAQNVSWY